LIRIAIIEADSSLGETRFSSLLAAAHFGPAVSPSSPNVAYHPTKISTLEIGAKQTVEGKPGGAGSTTAKSNGWTYLRLTPME
jgi:hypothetical protein